MDECKPPSRGQRAIRLRNATVLVPENSVQALHDLARIFRARERERTLDPPFGWRRISPSAELMVDPEPVPGVRSEIHTQQMLRVIIGLSPVLRKRDPVASGRANGRAEARLRAEAALRAYAKDDVPTDYGKSFIG